MFKVKSNCLNRLDIEMSGKLNADEMKIALDELVSKSKNIENGKMLYEIINRTYEHKFIVKSPDGTKCLFTRYNGRRYNRSEIWYGDKTGIRRITDKYLGKVSMINWSPNAKYVTFSNNGRQWRNAYVMTLKTKSIAIIELLDVLTRYEKEYGFDTNWKLVAI